MNGDTASSARRAAAVVTAMTIAVLTGSPAVAQAARRSTGATLEVVSSRPDMVSGGDALVRVSIPQNSANSSFQVAVAGRDVTGAFRLAGTGEYLGLVAGLPPGPSKIELHAAGKHVSLTVQNHPITGPAISGLPQQTLYACDTVAAGLGEPLDANCSANAKVEYLYKSTSPPPPRDMNFQAGRLPRAPEDFMPYDPKAPRPADMSTTVDGNGKTVDYVVRRERGTINRAIYEVLFRHLPGTPLPDPWTRTAGWNGRLVYELGGPCAAGYRQTWYTQPVNRPVLLDSGYAVVTSTIGIFGNDCNDVRAAETISMVKEKFSETYGPPVFTIGRGTSGGSMALHLVAQNYPGLLDGITPSGSFPDPFTLFEHIADCGLVGGAIGRTGLNWTDVQKQAVSGTPKSCQAVRSGSLTFVNPTACPQIPKDQVYNPRTNPKGLRCGYQDNNAREIGIDPKTGFARLFFDNVGVQYGLAAFNAGGISGEQFVALNEKAGGYDADTNVTESRTAVDAQTLHAYYGGGRINTASGSLTEIPIIDWRWYGDQLGDVHDSIKSYSARARLQRVNGAVNQVIWVMGDEKATDTFALTAMASALLNDKAIKTVDAWLTNLKGDTSNAPMRDKLIRAKPADAVDACFRANGERINDMTLCRKLYPPNSTPRQVAGAPLSDDVMKCQLRALDRKRYAQSLTDEQWQRLKAVFPKGVCDFSKPSIGYEKLHATWVHY